MQGSEAMGHRWPDETEIVRVFLDVEDRECRHCGRKMHVCDHRRHRIETLDGPRKIVCRLVKCIDRACPGHHRTVSPEAELTICLPRSIFWLGCVLLDWSPSVFTALVGSSDPGRAAGQLSDLRL